MNPLRDYLAYQAELGGDEVLLEAPLAWAATGARPVGSPPAAAAESRSLAPSPAPGVPGSRPAVVPVPAPVSGGSSLFEILSQSIKESDSLDKAARIRSAGIPSSSPAARPTESTSLPAFADMDACRAYLDRNLRGLLTGEAPPLDGKVVHGVGPEFAPLALVALEPGPDDLREGMPFQGEGGALLEKMMRAIKLDLGAPYRTQAVKASGGPGRRCFTRRDLVKLLPLLQAELELARVPVVLLLGEACAQAVLKTGKGLEELRQAPHRLDGVAGREFVVTWHPDELNGNDELKRKAWKDLQWLQQRMQGNARWN